jgi:LPS-assembly lipoprotein
LPSSFATVRIETEDAYSDFYRELRRSLVASGVEVTERLDKVPAVVKVRADKAGQRVVAVSARNTPEEFQVYYSVDYSVLLNGVEVGQPEHLELTTNYSYNSQVILAKQREQQRIQLALARDLASAVLRRLAAVPPSM